MKRAFLSYLSHCFIICMLALSPAIAAEGLQAVIKTTTGNTITVTSIAPDGRIEFTPEGGTKTKVLFKDIASIEWSSDPREHTITTHDGKVQKVTRAWIFAGNSAYMSFTGTDQNGEDANGTITGSDIASIVFSKAAAAPKQPEPKAADSAAAAAPKQPEPKAADSAAAEPAKAASTPAADATARPKTPSKRLSTSNLDYCYDQITEFDKKIDVIIDKYNRFKSQGKLYEPCKNRSGEDSWNWLSLQIEIQWLFSDIIGYYYSALQDGWETTDPDVTPLHAKIRNAAKKAEQAGYWTCADTAEKLDAARPDFFKNWDKIRLNAFEAMILTTQMNNAQHGQEIMEDAKSRLASAENYFAQEGAQPHPALLRLKAEVARLASECESAFKSVGNAKDDALAAWEALRAERQRLNDIMYKIENGQVHPNDHESFIEELEKFEKTESAVMREKIEALGKTCGNNLENLEAAMEKLLGKNPSGWDWSAEVKHFDKISKAIAPLRQSVGEDIASIAERDLNGMSSYDEAIRPQMFEKLKKLVQLGLRYDSHNTALIELAPKVEEAAVGDAAAVQKQIAERQWPGDDKGFSGPGTPAELNQAALDYFNSTCKPTEKALKACIVEPDWYCFKRNIFGQPIQWALTFWVAVDVEGETSSDIVYAWSISFLTEENVGVEKAPPFKLAAFNFKQKMKRANVTGL
ncbi:MAG: hypothetical protein A2W80_17750 [Candidatus Riflebacteria bacterium GWC2_50_8]|nr:MAG: hypothetical protein A2W80_17750 [Candidatus Riflebacteria bacterium GWC2_50_8]